MRKLTAAERKQITEYGRKKVGTRRVKVEANLVYNLETKESSFNCKGNTTLEDQYPLKDAEISRTGECILDIAIYEMIDGFWNIADHIHPKFVDGEMVEISQVRG